MHFQIFKFPNFQIARIFLFPLLNVILFTVEAQETIKKELTAVRTSQNIVVDGKLNEPEWQNAIPATDFQQFQFNFNQPSHYNTEVRILYDNVALYIGAYMYDPHPDSIMQELSKRDELGSSDFFDVIINPFNDGLNATEFIVSSKNVQLDAKMYPGSMGGEDFSWDAVWKSETEINADGWCAEIKIPYSALRFPNSEKQTWAIQFVREVKRNRDKSSWQLLDPNISGFVNQMGILNGIENIEAPVRLSVSPYISAYYDVYSDNENDVTSHSTSFNGGADLKYGLNDAFTLDMTLIPDFGQVQSDNQILNLTPFETKYVEQRQFFTEGTELFNKGGLFYSRRIGGTPFDYWSLPYLIPPTDEIIENPSEAQLINATKISGRTQSGTGLGFFNAIEGETYATIKNAEGEKYEYLTGPRTNYNVFVIDQNLKNNSYVTFINTNVLREGNYYDADVSGTDFQINDKKNIFGFNGGGAMSQKYFSETNEPELGYTYRLGAGKYSGKYTYDVRVNHEDEIYDPNDLGFLYNNNSNDLSLNAGYHLYTPLWHFNQLNINSNANYSRLVEPDEYYTSDIYLEGWAGFRNYDFGGIWFDAEPLGEHDWFEPRTPGLYYAVPDNYNFGAWISTDYSHRFAYDASANFRTYTDGERTRLNIDFSPRYRVNDKLVFTLSLNTNQWANDVGFVNYYGDSTVFGRRDNITYTTVLNTNYTPNVKMGFSFRMRHYWSYADYKEFYNLGTDGNLYPTTYNSFDGEGNSSDDVNFNAFTIDFVYSWFFAPGSQLDIVWKNSIYQYGNLLPGNYFDNAETVFNSPQSNNFSIKVLYYLDYLYMKKNG